MCRLTNGRTAWTGATTEGIEDAIEAERSGREDDVPRMNTYEALDGVEPLGHVWCWT